MAMTYDQVRAEFAKQNPQRPDLVPQKPQPQVAQVPQPMPKSQLAPAPTLAEKPLTPEERAKVDNIAAKPLNTAPSSANTVAEGVKEVRDNFMPETKAAWSARSEAIDKAPTFAGKLHESFAGLGSTAVAAYNDVFGNPARKGGDFVSEVVSGASPEKITSPSTPDVASPPKPNPVTEGEWKQQPSTDGKMRLTQYGGQGSGNVEITPNSAPGFNPRPDSRTNEELSLTELGNRNIRSGNVGGGTVTVNSGPGRPAGMSDAEWAAVPTDQKIKMNVAAYNQAAEGEKQRNLQRTAAADGRQVDEATGTIKGTVGYDRAHGDAGSVGDTGGYGILDKGYEAARAADMNRRGAADDMMHWANNHLGPKGRAAVASQITDNLSKPVSTGADIGDQIQLARLAQDQNQEANRSQLERQKMELDLAKWDREQAGAAEGRASEAAYKKAQISNMERTQQDKRAEDLDKVIGMSAGISAAPAELQGPLKQWAGGLTGNMPASQATVTVESALASALAEDQLTLKDLPNIKGDQLQKLYVRLQARLGKL